MTTQRGGRLGLLGPALWTGVVLIMLGTVYPVKAADDAAKAEAERLAAELRQSKQQLTALGAEFEKLRADLKDEQLKNAIDVDQEVKRLRDLLRASPEKEALEQALARAKADAAALEKKHAAQVDALRAEAERNADQARFAAKAQAEVERLNPRWPRSPRTPRLTRCRSPTCSTRSRASTPAPCGEGWQSGRPADAAPNRSETRRRADRGTTQALAKRRSAAVKTRRAPRTRPAPRPLSAKRRGRRVKTTGPRKS